MENNLKNQHYKNMSIMLQMEILTFEAESIAYVVCQYFGMDVSDYSFGYIAGWSTGKDTKELKESLEIIRDTSNDIISKTEQTLTQMQSVEQTVSETIQPKRRGRCM